MTLVLIIISTLMRLIIASSLELSTAEVYYWAYSLKLQLNYFDHPPIVAWLIRLTTANLLLHSEIFVRLGAIAAAAGSTWLIFKIGTAVYNHQTGWFAALLYTSSLYGSFIAGAFILPDSPQMFFWLASLLILIKISHRSSVDAKVTKLWCLFGLMAGLCIMSKIHGVFLWFGVALYAVIINRNWLKHPGLYIAIIITLTIISPIIVWNIQNNFVTYKFHSSRVTVTGAELHISEFLKELLQVIFLIANPVNFFLIFASLVWSFKGNVPADKKDVKLILLCSLPHIAVLLFVSLFRETLAHWSGPAYSCLLIIPAIKLASGMQMQTLKIPVILKFGLVYLIIIAVSEILITNFYPGTLSEEKNGLNVGRDDLTLDMYGWKEAGEKFDSLYRNDLSKNMMLPDAPIIVTNWFPAAHIDYYIAYKTKQQTFAIGNVLNLHQYYWMNEYKKQLQPGDNAYFIVPSNLFNYKTFDVVINSFKHYELALVVSQFRSGVICKELYIFRIKGYKRYKHLK